MRNLRVNADRLWDSLMEMAKIGALPGGGCCRLALTDEDKAGRDLFVSWCEEAGCAISIDQMGNIFARRPGKNPDLPPVVTGSHLDTQPHGGKYDGVYGVLAGLEVIRTLNDHGVETEAPVEVSVWTNEEGSRFAPSMISSGVFGGKFTLEEGLGCTDAEGKTLGEELRRIGYAGDLPCGGRKLGAFFEVHIEQGPILEDEDQTIGVVSGAQGQRWYDVTVTGQDSHAGTTPMPNRKDALVGAATMIAAVQHIALENAPDAVSTVGQLQVSPNSRNTIPGRVDFTVDLRHPSSETLEAMDARLREILASVADDTGLSLDLREVAAVPAVVFDEACVAAVAEASQELGFSSRSIVSGAGHDACYVARVAPAGMIFIPCANGLSHNEEESATPEDLGAGCDVLLRAMLRKAGVPAA